MNRRPNPKRKEHSSCCSKVVELKMLKHNTVRMAFLKEKRMENL